MKGFLVMGDDATEERLQVLRETVCSSAPHTIHVDLFTYAGVRIPSIASGV
jgi:hypothetical protein